APAPPPSPIRSLGYRAAMIRLRDEAASTSPPSTQLPSASRREDRPEIKRSCVTQREVGYGITDSWDEIVETLQGAPVSTDTELGGYVREFETRVRQDMDEIYMRLDDEQTERQLLAGRLNKMFRDRRAHAYTRQDFRVKDSLTGADHSPIGTGDSLADTCCYFTGIAGTAGTCWGPYTARATRGGWWQCID
nr:hypothetical protein [Tanacetum cinerariifolium]